MWKNLVQLYSLAVCLAAIILLMFNACFIVNSLNDLCFTEYKQVWRLSRYNDNQAFLAILPKNEAKQLSAAQLTEKRLEARQQEIKKIREQIWVLLFDRIGSAVVAMLFFFFHWRLYKRERIKLSLG